MEIANLTEQIVTGYKSRAVDMCVKQVNCPEHYEATLYTPSCYNVFHIKVIFMHSSVSPQTRPCMSLISINFAKLVSRH